MKVLFIALKYDYGNPKRGFSYEYLNFFAALEKMSGVEVDFFPFDEIMYHVGRKNMNEQLLERVHRIKPDCCFFVLFTDEIKKRTIKKITEKSGAITINWFCDDHWRFDIFSKYWAPCFHWVTTTDSLAVEKYNKIGYKNVIKTQWGFNPAHYRKYDLLQDKDITFVGQVHSNRVDIINYLKRKNINVECWGKGWQNGRLSQDEMMRIYSRSKINLNFTEGSMVFGWKSIAKILVNRRADNTYNLNSIQQMFNTIQILWNENRPQIKGRNFEIPGAGGFLLTQNADNLSDYFKIGEEIAVFEDADDLKDKIFYYLNNEESREKVRISGYNRAVNDHSYEKRFREIFKKIDPTIL